MQRSFLAVLGVIALVVLGVVAYLFLRGGDEPPAEPSPSVSPSAAASAAPSDDLNADLLDRRWTVLYVGTDLNERRESEGHVPNADAILLVSVSADQTEVAMVSLPRDAVDIPLPDGGTWPRKINALYSEEGVEGVVAAVSELVAVPIDGHVVLDMDDYTRLIAAVDGVDVDPDEPLVDPVVSLDLPAGPQEIDAETANAYVRTRVDQDYGRMARQQEVMVALIERLTDPERELDLGSLLDGFDSLETDLPLEDLATLLEVARRATDAEVRNLVVQPPLVTFEGDRDDGRGYILELDIEALRAEVAELIGE